MSRRVVAPVLLLVAAACSIAAVFAVHRIESGIGPVSQPSLVPPAISPNGDGEQDTASINFTLRERQAIDVEVWSEDGQRVARLVDGEVRSGSQQVEWDGMIDGEPAEDGDYRVLIKLEGGSRAFQPVRPLVVDTAAPIGVLDRATLELGELRGLAFLGTDEKLQVFDADGNLVRGLRQFAPKPQAQSAQPERTPPADTNPIRFTVALDAAPSLIQVVDLAGNRRQVFPDDDVNFRANG